MTAVPEALVRFAPPVARTLSRHPDLLGAVVAREVPDRDEIVRRAMACAADADGDDGAMKAGLRRLKYAVVGALILDDLDAGPAGVDRVGAALADLADALLEGALAHGRSALRRRGLPAGDFVAFAMGKHGAQELNYSSDIDLVYVARDLSGEARPAMDRLARGLGKLLSEPTVDGLCFRVDLNLRPEGARGPLVVSLPAAEHYYLTFGRTWERAAWLKARAAAGSADLGAELLTMIEPFRFRRHLDFGTLEDLAAMRDRIAASARLATLERDLKRGPGGIREIEFLIQATQLAWVGRTPELRIAGAMPVLRELAARDLLPASVDAEALAADYRFLRAVEHRIQWEAEAQTQNLPLDSDEDGWARLAATLGRSRGEELQGDIAAARARVEDAWQAVFTPDEVDEALTIVDPFASVTERTGQLETLGFAEPDEASARLLRLAEPSAQRRMRPSTWRRFERVAPRLATLAARSGDPDGALNRIEQFVGRVGARGTMYELLHENPAVMETLVRLFADSPYLADRFIQHPELLDALVMRGRGGEVGPRGRDAILDDLMRELDGTEEEAGLLALRTRQTIELLRIGLADLGGALPGAPSPHLVALAEALLIGADRLASRAMAVRHGTLRTDDGVEVPRGIVGLGSLGSGWLTYGSDLDLILVSRSEGESDGRRELDGRTFGARHVQRAVTALTASTREGTCYEVDLRLRPGGASGPLCTSIVGMERWYAEHAQPWERLMLSRSRLVWASTPAFGDEVAAALASARRGVAPRVLADEARRMRRRQQEELSAERARVLDLKLGPGGLTEIEFATACRQAGHPEAAGIADPVAAAAACGDLDPGDASILARTYRFLRRVESVLRLRSGGGGHLHLDSAEAPRIAAAVGFQAVDQLEGAVRSARAEALEVCERWLDSVP